MKNIVCLFFLFFCSISLVTAQKVVTAARITEAEKLVDISFTPAERDSMLGNMEDHLNAFVAFHKTPLINSDVPALYFNPLDVVNKSRAKSATNNFEVLPKKCELPKTLDGFAFYSIAELAYLIKNKKVSSLELTRFFIDRLKKYGDTLHCVINLTEKRAIAQALQADAEINSGKWRGLLHGIPYGAKDLIAVTGAPTTWGAKPFKNQSFDYDATIIKKLDTAGAVLVAKLSLGALAMDDVWFGGLTRNPWDLNAGSSGSSAGSAAATAAGLVPFAIGSETYGSIVSPSTVCGTTGLRPTFGHVSRYGAMTLCWSLDKLGPITRSANDAAIVLQAIQGEDEKDKTTSPRSSDFNYPSTKPLNQMRVGIIKEIFDTLNLKSNEWTAVNVLKSLGVQIVPVSFKIKNADEVMDITLASECAAAFDAFTRSNVDDEMNGQAKGDWPNYFRSARLIPAVEYINAQRLRRKIILEIDSIIKPFDAIIGSSFGGSQCGITNLTGHPVVAVPSGFENGKPTSVSFIGNYFAEGRILTLARAYQDKTDNHLKHPEMFSQH